MKRIFISSVQKEFAYERKLLKRYISRNPAYKRLFDTFVFEEDVVASDRRTDEVYLDELRSCDIYIGLIGNEYGYEDAEGVSPTEREYDEATRLGLIRLMFVVGGNNDGRAEKEIRFLKKISESLIRARCEDRNELLPEIYAGLDGLLVDQGCYRIGPFDSAICEGATLDDIDNDKVAWFVKKARSMRNTNIDETMSVESVLKHLKLCASKPSEGVTNSAILLFGRNPQRFHISSEVKCVQWYGKERHKPMLSYQIYKGTLFDMAEAARTFVLSKLDLRVGTRDNDIEASREYEIPSSAVAEAIVNAIAHRDYASSGSVQVELFSDRLVVRNPGTINPALKREDLFVEHASYPNNSLIADQLYQTKLIEKFGTGLTDLVEDCRKAGLRDPVIDDSRTEFVITIWRPDKKSGPLEKQEEQVANSCNCDKNTFLEALHDLKSKIKGGLVIGGDPDDAITAAIYEAIKLSPGIKRAKLIRIVRKSKATIERCLSSLKAQEKIEYRGSNKTGGYYVVEGN